ncbi:YbaN family protein [Psychromonas hadalis]|uniref:YbaN family protein n=1 Tax=Psychromonas hadalis TaxID=211669 RepID=UPI0003B5839B|nr:YbaN family protein [Psychromonas hadalis]
MQQIKRYLLISVGFTSVLLGIIGVFLPLLPTTPFFILALSCFARSSTHFHQKLLTTPYIGQLLADWETDKKIDKQRKKQIMLLVIGSFTFSIFILTGRIYLQLMLISTLFILLFFIQRIDEK